MHATKIMFNSGIAEVIAFRKRIAEDTPLGSQSMAVIPNVQRISMEDDFMKLHPKKYIDQVNEIKEDGSFIVLGTIKAIVEDVDWWYSACKCNKAVILDSGMYYCDSCLHMVNITPRYRIKHKVEDDSGSSLFVLFDRDGQCLLKKSCSKLLAEHNKSRGCGGCSDVLHGLVGQKLLFKVETKEALTSQFDSSFRVKRVCSNETILGVFLLQGVDNTPAKVIFSPPFPSTYNLGDDGLDVEVLRLNLTQLLLEWMFIYNVFF